MIDQVFRRSAELGEDNDCSVKAVALACGLPYDAAHAAFEDAGRRHGRGVLTPQIFKALKVLKINTQPISHLRQPNGSRYTPRTISRLLPFGRYLVYTRGHVFALVDGQVLDWTKGRKHHIIGFQRVEV